MQTNYTPVKPTGYQAISATSSTAVGCTIPTPGTNETGSNYALFVPETTAVRWRDDGTDPVNAASGGWPLSVGQALEYDGTLSAIKFVSQTGTATIHASYYRTS